MQVINSDVYKIETVLKQHPAVRQVAVIDHQGRDGEKYFVAYLVGYLAVDRIPLQGKCWCEDTQGKRVQLSIADISYNGICLLNTPHSWFIDKVINISLNLPGILNPVQIPGRVVWHERQPFSLGNFLANSGLLGIVSEVKKDRTGVLFDPNSSAINIIRQTIRNISRSKGIAIQDLRRSDPRVPLHTNVRVHFADGRSFGWEAENISLTGIRIQGIDGIWQKGKSLRLGLRLPGSSKRLDLKAIVWWHRGSQAGLRLHLNKAEESTIYQSIEHIINTQGLSLNNLHSLLETNLPPELIPYNFIMLEEMPLDAYGAVDLAALPKLDF